MNANCAKVRILLFVVDGVLTAADTLGSPMEMQLSQDKLIRETPVSDERHPVVGVIFRQTQQNCHKQKTNKQKKTKGNKMNIQSKRLERFEIFVRMLPRTRMAVIDQRQRLAYRIIISKMDRQKVLGLGCGWDDVDWRLLIPTAQIVEIVPMRWIYKGDDEKCTSSVKDNRMISSLLRA